MLLYINTASIIESTKTRKSVTIVGFVAAAVSMPMGGCRARRLGGDVSLVSAETVDVVMTAKLAVL